MHERKSQYIIIPFNDLSNLLFGNDWSYKRLNKESLELIILDGNYVTKEATKKIAKVRKEEKIKSR